MGQPYSNKLHLIILILFCILCCDQRNVYEIVCIMQSHITWTTIATVLLVPWCNQEDSHCMGYSISMLLLVPWCNQEDKSSNLTYIFPVSVSVIGESTLYTVSPRAVHILLVLWSVYIHTPPWWLSRERLYSWPYGTQGL